MTQQGFEDRQAQEGASGVTGSSLQKQRKLVVIVLGISVVLIAGVSGLAVLRHNKEVQVVESPVLTGGDKYERDIELAATSLALTNGTVRSMTKDEIVITVPAGDVKYVLRADTEYRTGADYTVSKPQQLAQGTKVQVNYYKSNKQVFSIWSGF